MRRTIAIILCVLSLVFSICAVICCIVGMKTTKQVIDQSQVVALETAMRTYADSLDSIRDSIDVTGSQIPVYALTLKRTAKLVQDTQVVANELEKYTMLEVNVPLVGTIRPFESLKTIVSDLRDFLPQFGKSLSAAEESLSGYTLENHEKIIDSIDKTVLLLKTNADKLQEQVEILRKCIYVFLAMCIVASLAHCGLATAILLVLPSSSHAQATTPVRRKVSFA
ncbi:MAG: hypothetical protein J5654_03345 [Victivallales bacterium]|nr:hypothetical protein [Victivallales bacterium]